MAQPKQDTTKLSPMRLVLVVLLSTFTIEFGIMMLLSVLRPIDLSEWVEAVIDSSVLSALLFLVLFFLSFRPLARQVEELEQAEKELERTQAILQDALRARRDDGWLEIAVADTGIGIAREDLAKMFKPLAQLDAGLARQYGGVGLGLALARRTAELHGGTIEVESEPGKGSTFTLRLPIREKS